MDSMLGAVEGAIGSAIHEDSVQSRPSAKGSYISVTIGPVTVQNRDQVHRLAIAHPVANRGITLKLLVMHACMCISGLQPLWLMDN